MPPVSAETPIVIEFNGQQVSGVLDDTAVSRSLVAQLPPLELSFRDFGGQEKIATLPRPLDLSEAPAGSDAPALTVGYYAPDQGLVLYYESVGYYGGIVRLGTFTDSATLQAQGGQFTGIVRLAN